MNKINNNYKERSCKPQMSMQRVWEGEKCPRFVESTPIHFSDLSYKCNPYNAISPLPVV